MAISLVAQISEGSGSTVQFTTADINSSGADFLVFCRCLALDRSDAMVSDSKMNTWTQLTGYNSVWSSVDVFYSVPTTVGANHNFTGNEGVGVATYPVYFILALSGLAQSSTFDQQTGNTNSAGVSTLQAGSITPSIANEIFIACVCDAIGSGSDQSIDSGFTSLTNRFQYNSSHVAAACAYKIKVNASAENPTYSGLNGGGVSDAAMSLVCFKPPVTAASSSPKLSYLGAG